ncbi:MAG: hypothetical protein ACP5G7_03295 [Anaerolineae bacterium]
MRTRSGSVAKRFLAPDRIFDGRPVDVADDTPPGSDSPLRAALSLRGQGMLLDLAVDPDYAEKLMAFITQAAITFVLREGTNLPPRTPPDNLAAMDAACLERGRYP